jgi:hypothetical protein
MVVKNNCIQKNTFSWVENCCYIDAVIVAFFIGCSNFAKKHLNKELKQENGLKIRKNIQSKLKIVFDIMMDTSKNQYIDCKIIRKYIKYHPTSDNFHSTDLNDASDFLKYIFDILEIKSSHVNETVYGTDNVNSESPRESSMYKISEKVKKESNIFENNDLPYLKKNKIYTTKKFLKSLHEPLDLENNFNYERKIIKKELIKTDCLILRINRYFDDDIFYKTKIIPSRKIKHDNAYMYLSAILVFENSHYTCYFLCEGEWYYYNDASLKKIKYIGQYDIMIKSTPSPISNGILYFYNKKNIP